MPTQSNIIARFPSESNPRTRYTVKCGQDNNLYCDCAAWRFQRKPAIERACNHTRLATERLAQLVRVNRNR